MMVLKNVGVSKDRLGAKGSLFSLSLQGLLLPLTLPPPSISKGYPPRAARVKDPRRPLTWLRLGDPPVVAEVHFEIVVWLKFIQYLRLFLNRQK